jgi:hypothetical protein
MQGDKEGQSHARDRAWIREHTTIVQVGRPTQTHTNATTHVHHPRTRESLVRSMLLQLLHRIHVAGLRLLEH